LEIWFLVTTLPVLGSVETVQLGSGPKFPR
jgi:hypothetical protein